MFSMRMGMGLGAGTEGTVIAENVLNVFLAAGQSNSEGRYTVVNDETWISDGIVDNVNMFTGSAVEPWDIDTVGRYGNGVNVISGYAKGTLTSTNTNPEDGDTVTIGPSITYRFKSTMAQAYDVQIGADADASMQNLIHAINGTGEAGTNYYAGTSAHALVSALPLESHGFVVLAKEFGAGGNDIATTENSSQLSWGGANLANGGGASGVGKYSWIEYGLSLIGAGMQNLCECRISNGSSLLAKVTNASLSWNSDIDGSGWGASTIKLYAMLKAKYEALVAWCAANDYTLNVRGLCWHQGESDNPTFADEYSANWVAFIAAVRTLVGNDSLPVFYGSVGENSTGYNATIETAQFGAADNLTKFCRDNWEATHGADNVHFSEATHLAFGQWLKDKWTAYAANSLVPDAPLLLAETEVGASGFTANWRAAISATSYELDYSESEIFASDVTTIEDIEAETYAITGLDASTTYYWRVRAVNAKGASANSATGSQLTESDVYVFTNQEAEDYVAEFSSEPTDAAKEIIDDLVTALKSTNVGDTPTNFLAKLDRLYLFNMAHDTAADTLIDLINPDTVAATLHNSGGESADPTWAAKAGFTTDGTNYIDVKFNPDTAYSSGDYQYGAQAGEGAKGNMMGIVFHGDPLSGSSTYDFGCAQSGRYAMLRLAHNDTPPSPVVRYLNSSTFTATTLADSTSPKTRYFMVARVPADGDRIMVASENGAELSGSLTEGSRPPYTVFVGGYNNSGSLAGGNTTYPAIWFAGCALTSAEWTVFRGILSTYIGAMGAL